MKWAVLCAVVVACCGLGICSAGEPPDSIRKTVAASEKTRQGLFAQNVIETAEAKAKRYNTAPERAAQKKLLESLAAQKKMLVAGKTFCAPDFEGDPMPGDVAKLPKRHARVKTILGPMEAVVVGSFPKDLSDAKPSTRLAPAVGAGTAEAYSAVNAAAGSGGGDWPPTHGVTFVLSGISTAGLSDKATIALPDALEVIGNRTLAREVNGYGGQTMMVLKKFDPGPVEAYLKTATPKPLKIPKPAKP